METLDENIKTTLTPEELHEILTTFERLVEVGRSVPDLCTDILHRHL